MSSAEVQPLAGQASVESGEPWLLPAAGIGRGLFELALRAASLAWHPSRTIAPLPSDAAIAAATTSVADPAMALPVVLEAWRATERELAGMTGDSPDQEYLEANATMLQEMYQRLYSERMRR